MVVVRERSVELVDEAVLVVVEHAFVVEVRQPAGWPLDSSDGHPSCYGFVDLWKHHEVQPRHLLLLL